jgi:hypothetical protein
MTSPFAIDPHDPALARTFSEDGFLILREVVPKDRLEALNASIIGAFERAKADGSLFRGGGMFSGHLNCFPGAASRFVHESLEAARVTDLVKVLLPAAKRLPNVGCNLNLPGSSAQNRHVDGYAAAPFAVVNIASVDTTLGNGAMEVLPGTHRRSYKYWELVMERPKAIRPLLNRGDVLVRTSMLWHRGMPNTSARPRPMLALTWEDGGSTLEDPYAAHGGQISFFPNRYRPTGFGRLRERAFVAVPRVNSALRFVRSFFES